MNRYIAKLVFRIICGQGKHMPQFDEQLRLIFANDEAAALEKAQLLGKSEQETFLNNQNELVQWQFIDIPELYNLNALNDGVEICSRVHETHEYNNYVDLVHYKADEIRARLNQTAIEHA